MGHIPWLGCRELVGWLGFVKQVEGLLPIVDTRYNSSECRDGSGRANGILSSLFSTQNFLKQVKRIEDPFGVNP